MQMYLSKVKIREAMDRQRIKTYTELAEQLGITKNQLSVMLSDDYNPLKTRVEDLCQLLSVLQMKSWILAQIRKESIHR